MKYFWIVNGNKVEAPRFVDSPGPGLNKVSRLTLNSGISLSIYRRRAEGVEGEWLELAVFNDPLRYTKPRNPADPIPATRLPDVSFQTEGQAIGPIMWDLFPWKNTAIDTVHLFLADPTWAACADGAGIVAPFFAKPSERQTLLRPKIQDLVPFFPGNPGSIWGLPVRLGPFFGAVQFFDTTGNPWAVQGNDKKDFWEVGFHEDWKWCHIPSYYREENLIDLEKILPTVYRQAARPCHYHGLKIDGLPSQNGIQTYMGRPRFGSTDMLGRDVDAEWKQIAPNFTGWYDDVSSTRYWTGPDNEHASFRRLGEFALATGSPWACAETAYQGELSKGAMRVMSRFGETTRAYLAQSEIAYRGYLISGDRSAVDCAIEIWKKFIAERNAGAGGSKPWPLTTQISDQWIPGEPAAAAYEDLRAVPIMLKMGEEFLVPELVTTALQVCEFYTTKGYDPAKGLAVHINPWNNRVSFYDWTGYHCVSALGLRLAADYLEKNPQPAALSAGVTTITSFQGPLYKQVSSGIVLRDNGNQPGWMFW